VPLTRIDGTRVGSGKVGDATIELLQEYKSLACKALK